jgi:hypothetical protein
MSYQTPETESDEPDSLNPENSLAESGPDVPAGHKVKNDRRAWLTLAALVVFFAVGNLALPGVFWPVDYVAFNLGMWHYRSPIFWAAWGAAVGVLLAEISILAIWIALGSELWIYRLLIGYFMLLFLVGCNIAGLSIAAVLIDEQKMPSRVVLYITLVAVVECSLACLPLYGFRLFSRWQLASFLNFDSRPRTNQFSLRSILVVTSCIALLIAFYQAVSALHDSAVTGPGTVEWVPALAWGIYSIVLTMLSLPLVARGGIRRRTRALFAVALVGCPIVAEMLLARVAHSYFVSSWSAEERIPYYTFSYGLVAASLTVLYILRGIGMPLVRGTRASVATQAALLVQPATD